MSPGIGVMRRTAVNGYGGKERMEGTYYYQRNEVEVNGILLRCALVLVFVGPFLAILRAIGINGEFNYLECFYLDRKSVV